MPNVVYARCLKYALYAECHNSECHNAECHLCCVSQICHLCWMSFMPSVTIMPFMLSVIMLNVIYAQCHKYAFMLSVIMLNVIHAQSHKYAFYAEWAKMIFSLITLSINGIFEILSKNDIQHNDSVSKIPFVLSVVMLSVIMLRVVPPSFANVHEPWGRFVKRRLVLSSSFRCDQIY